MLKLDINLLFTVINLVVWYLLIKKFLFKPVNNIISKREEAIADRYREAEQEKVQAGEQKQKYEALQSSIQDEKTKVMQKAQEDAREAYRQIVDEANRKAGIFPDGTASSIRSAESAPSPARSRFNFAKRISAFSGDSQRNSA